MSVTEITAGLGHFAKLPRELRDLVWGALLCQDKSNSTRERKHSLAILRTSKQISKETCPQLYPSSKKSFLIELSPDFVESRLNDHFTVSKRWRTGAKTWNIKIPNGCSDIYHMGGPHRRLRFEIGLEATQANDPGQRIILYQRLSRVVKFLRNLVTRPYQVKIDLRDCYNRSWFPDDDDKDNAALQSFFVIVQQFLSIRDVSRPILMVPRNATITKKRSELMRAVIAIMKRKERFGEYVSNIDCWSDQAVIARMKQSEKILANMKATAGGSTCMMLRLQICLYNYPKRKERYEPYYRWLKTNILAEKMGRPTVWVSWVFEKDELVQNWMNAEHAWSPLRRINSLLELP